MEFPGYEVKRTIGRGGMATVYLAIQQSLDREIVLKTLNTTHDESGDFFERFLKEGRIIASLRPPHIVTIFDIGSADDTLYISMEYVEGGDLRAKIENRLAPVRGLELVSKIGQALAYAHKKGIVHRDVKPANILFRADGTPLLSDFGIAKDFTVDKGLTSTGTILGSPSYMSPEQAEGLPVDGRTDIYSLGVIFYEMLTGQKPYEGDSAIKVIMKHIQSPVPQLPPELDQFQPLLNRLMAKDRDQRIGDAGELVTEVEDLREEVEGKKGRGMMTLHSLKLPLSARARERRDASVGRGSRTVRMLVLAGVMFVVLGGLGAFMIAQLNKPPALLVRNPPPVVTSSTAGATGGGVGTQSGANGAVIDEQSASRALEWLARNSLRQDRLMSPPADNAHYYFSRLLAINPDNDAAKQGFSAIAERFVVLAEEEFSRKRYGRAQAYITLGLQVEPNNKGLETLRSMIETREKTFFETVADYFKS
ncbi:MAG: protein kinase [Proteobacteria bacterium]|nr:protein kinase [Pseudomonadota bacterium]